MGERAFVRWAVLGAALVVVGVLHLWGSGLWVGGLGGALLLAAAFTWARRRRIGGRR